MEFLLVIEPASGGRYEHRLPSGSYILGREEASCDIPIHSPEVSRQHARIHLAVEECWVEDLGSTAGTLHDGRPLAGKQNILMPAELFLGTTRLSIAVDELTGMTFASGDLDEATVQPSPVITFDQDDRNPPVQPVAAGHYTKGREIARGGMGAILEANDRMLGRTVAMKVVLKERASEEARMRFIREATVLGQLEHPNIIPIHELGKDDDGNLFYAMKMVEGRTLQAILNDLKKGDSLTIEHYTLDRLLTVFRKVCDAIAFAHSKGIVHRDLKPENVMVGAFGEVLVMDWGLAKILKDVAQTTDELEQQHQALVSAAAEAKECDLPEGFLKLTDSQMRGGSEDLTMEGAIMGSPQYMPAEQADGRIAEIDERSDIYSLGGILYAILTLRPPIRGRRINQLLENVRSGRITAPTEHSTEKEEATPSKTAAPDAERSTAPLPLPHCPGGRIPPALSAVAMKALMLQPADRYQSVGDLSGDIEAHQEGFATSAEELNVWGQMVLFIRRHRAISFAAVVSLILSLALSVGFTLQIKEERDYALIQEGLARQEKAEARRSAATANLNLAEAALREGDSAAIQAALEQVPADLRETTWRYLLGEADTSIAILQPDGHAVQDVVPDLQREGFFYVADSSGRITRMNVRTGDVIRDYASGIFSNKVYNGTLRIAVSDAGRRLAVGSIGWVDGEWGAGIVLLDKQSGRPLRSLDARITSSLEFGPDGRLLLQRSAATAHSYGLNMWDTDSGELLWRYERPRGYVHGAFLKDGDTVLTVGAADPPRLVEARTGRLIRVLTGNIPIARSLALGDGGRFAVQSPGKQIHVRNLASDGFARVFETGSRGTPGDKLIWTPDGDGIITAAELSGGRLSIQLRNPETGMILRSFLGGNGIAQKISIHPASQEMIVVGQTTRVWPLLGQREKWTFKVAGRGLFQFFGSDDTVIIPDEGNFASIQRIVAGNRKIVWKPDDVRYGHPTVSGDGRTAALGLSKAPQDPVVILRRNSEVIEAATSLPIGPCGALRLGPRGERILVDPAAWMGTPTSIAQYETFSGRQLSSLERHGMTNLRFEWLGRSNRVVGVATTKGLRNEPGAEERVFLWDSETGKILKSVQYPTPMTCLAVSPDGSRFAEAGADKKVRIRDSETLAISREFRVHDDVVSVLAWHPTRSVLASASGDLAIRLWNIENGRRLQEFRGPRDTPVQLAFSPSGRYLGCAVPNEPVRIWEPESLLETE